VTSRTQFFLITTASLASATEGTLERLLRSVLPSPAVHVLCVARGWDVRTQGEIASRFGEGLTLLSGDENLTLSASRNLAIRHLHTIVRPLDAVAAFPDDDCWYPAGTVELVTSAFSRRPDVAAIAGCYGPSKAEINRERFPSRHRDLNAPAAARQTSSVTVFTRTDAMFAIGGFNPMLGAGAEIPAGEDIDFVLRLLDAGYLVAYDPDIMIGHEYKTESVYVGPFLLVIASHLSESPELAPILVRSAIMSVCRHPRGKSRFGELAYVKPSVVRRVRMAGRQLRGERSASSESNE
jgi:hypothetical protein